MSSPLRHVAPAGAPIGPSDLVTWACAMTRDSHEELRAAISARFAVRHCVLVSTGRAGLSLALSAMRDLASAGRDEVIVPSYTCYSVAASIARAGLRLRVVDVDVRTLDLAGDQLAAVDCSRVVAMVATNLYGLPGNLPGWQSFAHRQGIRLIDDAAQSMGAIVGGRPSGTWGDAGLFSFDKGKNIAAVDGGAVVTDWPELAVAVSRGLAGTTTARLGAECLSVGKALAYAALLHPNLYWIPQRLPFLGLGATRFDIHFPPEQPNRVLPALALTMLGRLDAFTASRRANAGLLLDRLASIDGVTSIISHPDSTPVYLRLPVLLPDGRTRDEAIRRLQRIGVGATASYPKALPDVPDLASNLAGETGSDAGRSVAARILTLPTHPFVTVGDIDRMTEVLRALLRAA